MWNWVDSLVVVERGWVDHILAQGVHNQVGEDSLVSLDTVLDIDSVGKVFDHMIVSVL